MIVKRQRIYSNVPFLDERENIIKSYHDLDKLIDEARSDKERESLWEMKENIKRNFDELEQKRREYYETK